MNENENIKKYYIWTYGLIVTLIVGMISFGWLLFTCVGFTCILFFFDKKINNKLTELSKAKYKKQMETPQKPDMIDFFKGCMSKDDVEKMYIKLEQIYSDNEQYLAIINKQYEECKKRY